MLIRFAQTCRKGAIGAALAVLACLAAAPANAQSIETVDPDAMIDADLSQPSSQNAGTGQTSDDGYTVATQEEAPSSRYESYDPPSRYADQTLDLPPDRQGQSYQASNQQANAANANVSQPETTYGSDDLIGAAEGLFGKGAEGLARMIEGILDEQGEPNGYIVGREGGGAFIIGVRYGSGTLFHAVEGNMPVYWTGPSIGLDAGANAGNTFVLVYNLLDTDELYERFPAGEGQAYLVGGFNASYVRKGNVVLIPIRVGAGLRLGINAGYMKFSREQEWLPF